MWDIKIQLRQNNFLFVKRYEDASYKIINSTNEFPIIENVVRWFNNGFFLTRDEEYIERELSDGRDGSYTTYYYKIYNNDLKEIFSEISENSNQFDDLKDFFDNYLVIKGGVIDNYGNVFIPFKYSQDEAEVRLFVKNPMEQFHEENIKAKVRYLNTKVMVLNLDYINDFIAFLKKEIKETNEIIYHLLLRRYLHGIKSATHNILMSPCFEFILANYDITYIVKQIISLLAIEEPLTINYWDRYNSYYSYKKIEFDLQDFLNSSELQLLTQRKSHLDQIISSLNLMNFSQDRFKEICRNKETILKNLTSLIRGRKVYIQEYQTIQSNFKDKKSNLSRTPCIYIGKPQFLDQNIFPNFHFVQDSRNTSNYYIVDEKAIFNDFLSYDYNDYLEVFKIKKIHLS